MDKTDTLQVNSDFTYNLYHNSAPGFKLVGGMAHTQISIPVRFMGIPIPVCNKRFEKIRVDLVEKKINECENINTRLLRDGGVWVWPSYSHKTGKVNWEMITGDKIGLILKDLDTDEIEEILIDEQLTVSTGENQQAVLRRKRFFRKDSIKEVLTGGINRTVTYKNVLGILPIAFLNDSDNGTYLGHSEYEKTVYDLKGYHDIDQLYTELLSKFRPKMVQTTMNPKNWLAANGVSPNEDYQVSKVDLILNNTMEKTQFIFPENMSDPYINERKLKFHKIVESSGTPEICWGLKTEGNNASAGEQMLVMVGMIKGKRNYTQDSYKQLFEASLRLLGIVNMIPGTPDTKIKWNKLDGLGEKARSDVFEKYCDGISKAANIGCMTSRQIYDYWEMLYPDSNGTFEEFEEGIKKFGRNLQWLRADYTDVKENGKLESETKEKVETPKVETEKEE
ncbi:MAG: hypothetical protein WC175_04270 [Candidatus Dojkabacteria bacterium]